MTRASWLAALLPLAAGPSWGQSAPEPKAARAPAKVTSKVIVEVIEDPRRVEDIIARMKRAAAARGSAPAPAETSPANAAPPAPPSPIERPPLPDTIKDEAATTRADRDKAAARTDRRAATTREDRRDRTPPGHRRR